MNSNDARPSAGPMLASPEFTNLNDIPAARPPAGPPPGPAPQPFSTEAGDQKPGSHSRSSGFCRPCCRPEHCCRRHKKRITIASVVCTVISAITIGLCIHYLLPPSFSNADLSMCSTVSQADSRVIDHSLWDDILKEAVNTNQNKSGVTFSSFNYHLVRSRFSDELEEYLEVIADTPLTGMSCDEYIALYINAYNALAVNIMLEHDIPASIKDIYPLSPYSIFSVYTAGAVGGIDATLDNIEHDVLRKSFPDSPDPRIHAAVVCASLSCPDIRGEAFTGENVQRQLTEQAQLWMGNPTKGQRVSVDGGSIKVSKIFDWYKVDFDNKYDNGPLGFIHEYMPSPKFDPSDPPSIGYFEYLWDRNEGQFSAASSVHHRTLLLLPVLLMFVL